MNFSNFSIPHNNLSIPALDFIPSYLYTFKNNELTGYPFLNPIGNTTQTTKEIGINLSSTELKGAIGGCFLKPDTCHNGTTLSIKLNLGNSLTDNSQQPVMRYILRSHGIELFEDQYNRLCGLVRSHYPSREWKVLRLREYSSNA